MDSLFDRLGLYDFFNVITIGGILLFYCIAGIFYLDKQLIESIEAGWILNIGLLLVSYLLGLICQEIGSVIIECKWCVKRNQLECFLNKENKVIDNKHKVETYRAYAGKILNLASVKGYVFDYEESRRVFAYCIYYVENLGKNQKIEKMRALVGMAQNMIGAAVLLPLSCVGVCLLCGQFPDVKFGICSVWVFGVLLLLGIKRVASCHKYMICVTMGAYEACMKV